MAFTLRVVFTGLCTFVRNQDETKAARMCVVLPNGRDDRLLIDKLSADGRDLRRHRGFIQFKVHQLAAFASSGASSPTDADAIWYLDHHRVTFLTTPADRQRGRYPYGDTGLNRIAKLDLIVPKYSEIDPEALKDYPPEKILAQVLLHEGILSVNGELRQWVFPTTLSGRVLNPSLSHEVILRIEGLQQVDVIATPFNGGPPTKWSFVGTSKEDVTITIANLCDDNPLRWETSERDRNPDEDFRWYYRMLSETAQRGLNDELRGLPFPVPQPLLDLDGNAQGLNCIPSQTKAASFNLDHFLPADFSVQASKR